MFFAMIEMLFQRPLPHALLALLLLVSMNGAGATPHSNPTSSGVAVPLVRRAPSARTVEEWGKWAKGHKERLTSKYGGNAKAEKRSSGTNLLVNQGFDSSFYGSLAIGTPAVSYNVILDTGSSDLWIADSNCLTGCQGVQTFDTSTSSTFVDKNTTFSITYGSGAAKGSLGQDVVQMAGFSVKNQVFATCDQVSQDLLNAPVSGLLGLGFASISSARATPFWETLVKSNAWDEPLMAFQLTRFVNVSDAQKLEFGGSFTMGALDSSLYTGDIEYINIPDGLESYWIQQISEITVQGSVVTPSGTNSLAAIDTGTTLIGGPASEVANFWSLVPGSAPGTGNFEGYYTFPCDTEVQTTISFGGTAWSISSSDMIIGQLNNQLCLGAVFQLSTGNNAPSWIVGDTFLKNVYSVFRYSPASVGFARLSAKALALSNADTAVPTATIGSAAATVSATGASRDSDGNSASGVRLGGSWRLLCVVLVVLYVGQL